MRMFKNPYWLRHPGLVWSNPDADDAVFILAALVRPRFGRLLDITLEFGLERVRSEWMELQLDGTPEITRARPVVERILSNIAKGFEIAAADRSEIDALGSQSNTVST